MGMSERGQIGRLSEISQPDFVMITMIGLSHLSTLGSREAIASAKLEITEGLAKDGELYFNGDEPLLINKVDSFEKPIPHVRFGLSSTNDYYAEDIQVESDGVTFKCRSNQYHIPIIGKHNVINALAAIAITEKMGLQPAAIKAGLNNVIITGMRMEKIVSATGITIINDAWNASPVSMKAAIDTLIEMKGFSNKIVVLGDMLELGYHELEYHREIGRYLKSDNIDYVFTLGILANEIAQEAEKHFPSGKVKSYQNQKELIKAIQDVVYPTDVILVKGSRGMNLEKVVEGLINR